MAARVLIVGQGIAGTALAWACERRGVDFLLVHGGEADAASHVAAGLINPVSGQRWARAEQVDELLPAARAFYQACEHALGVPLWHPVSLTRFFRDEAERVLVQARLARGELAPFATAVGEHGVEVIGAAWVDLPALLRQAAARWRGQGRCMEARLAAEELNFRPDGVRWREQEFTAAVLAVGAGELVRQSFAFLPLAPSKGEILLVRGGGVPRDEVRHRGVWVLGGADQTARIGATFDRTREDFAPTAEAREELLRGAEGLVSGEVTVLGQAAGVRLATPDRRPVIGWHPQQPRLGICGALSSKGALWAPWLADIWARNLAGATNDWPAAASVSRFAKHAARVARG